MHSFTTAITVFLYTRTKLTCYLQSLGDSFHAILQEWSDVCLSAGQMEMSKQFFFINGIHLSAYLQTNFLMTECLGDICGLHAGWRLNTPRELLCDVALWSLSQPGWITHISVWAKWRKGQAASATNQPSKPEFDKYALWVAILILLGLIERDCASWAHWCKWQFSNSYSLPRKKEIL